MKCPACNGTGKPKVLLPNGKVVEVQVAWCFSNLKCALCSGTGIWEPQVEGENP